MENKVNILFGPPKYGKERMILSFFFNLPGKHIVCGGTTVNLVSDYLKKPLTVDLTYHRDDVPPVGKMDGVDLVTEGFLTLTRLKEMLINGETPERDAASLIYKEISAADEICFVCGELSEEKKILLAEIVARLQKRTQKATVLNGTSLSER